MGEADDVGERRAQLVGDVLDEIDLDGVRLHQRFVALGEHALDVHRGGDVVEGDERRAIRKGHGAAVDDGIVSAGDAQRPRRAVVEGGDGGAQRLPGRLLGMERTARRDDRLDMRMLVEHRRREAPHGGEFRIEQPHPPVAAEHRDGFGQIVEGFALDPDQRIETPLEIEPLGDVVEEIGDPAVGIGRGDDAQRAQVRQVPHELLGLGGAVGRVQLPLPRPEVLLLGQPSRRPQAVEHGGVGRMLVEEARARGPTACDRRRCRRRACGRRRRSRPRVGS